MKLLLRDDFERGDSTQRITLIIISIICTFFGTSTIVARFYIRAIVTKSVGKDDYFIFAAWFASILYTVASGAGIKYGVGQTLIEEKNDSTSKAIEATFFVEIFYYLSLYLVKASILLFYLRLVDTLRGKFYMCTLISFGVLSLHFVSTIIVVFLQCRPISFYWNQNQPGSCVDITSFFYSTATNGFTIASDLVILGLPLPTLLRVKRPWKDKLALVIVFGAGAISTIASCIRLYTIKLYTLSHNPLYDAAPINTWSFIEINIGMACASGPSLKAFYTHITRRVRKTKNEIHNADVNHFEKRSTPQNSVHWWWHLNKTDLASEGSKGGITREYFEQGSEVVDEKTEISMERIKPMDLGLFLTDRTYD